MFVAKMLALLPFLLAVPVSAFAQGDEVEGPWGTINADNSGTAATDAIPYILGEGPVEVAWKLDVRGEGQERVAGRNPITFDRDGNLYWKTSIGGGTGGIARVVSASPDGDIRWAGNDGAGSLHGLGNFYDGTGVVVGGDLVYALGGFDTGELFVAAYRKDTGALEWETLLDFGATGARDVGGFFAADLLTPVLHGGKLYIVAPDEESLLPKNVYQVHAEDGYLDWVVNLPEIAIAMTGQITLVPDAFAEGEHGLYFNGDSGSGIDSVPEVYGVRVTASEGLLAWSAEGGKVARSHLIYSDVTGTLYAHTWSDYGAQLYTYHPTDGPLAANTNAAGTGHGFFDVGCLDFNGTDIIAGGFQGLVIRYFDQGQGITTSETAFDDENLTPGFWGEYRVYGQLLRAPNGNSVLITGTNSDVATNPSYTARVVAIDVTASRLLWEFDTGVAQDIGFTVRGGPIAGPDGKVYYFDAVTGELVALKAGEIRFIRGDCNGDGSLNIGDAVKNLFYQFRGDLLDCVDAADVDDNGQVEVTDIIHLLTHLFLEGPAPEPPFPDCGPDEGDDDFPPCNYPQEICGPN